MRGQRSRRDPIRRTCKFWNDGGDGSIGIDLTAKPQHRKQERREHFGDRADLEKRVGVWWRWVLRIDLPARLKNEVFGVAMSVIAPAGRCRNGEASRSHQDAAAVLSIMLEQLASDYGGEAAE